MSIVNGRPYQRRIRGFFLGGGGGITPPERYLEVSSDDSYIENINCMDNKDSGAASIVDLLLYPNASANNDPWPATDSQREDGGGPQLSLSEAQIPMTYYSNFSLGRSPP